MKSDNSKKNITIAALRRKIMNPEEWIYSKAYFVGANVDFDLEENELSVFEVKSVNATTLITTRRIIEKSNDNIDSVKFEDVDNVRYDNFKGDLNKPQLSIFRIIDFHGKEFSFQMETGKASIGLINAINTLLRLK
ncbi:hypothetical protein B0A67_02250 [Flavobacterium aquidurense]|jgi:hypothetical protein|uniref:hypothetical protein n=1 Tax=Flavobacterium aquidurense TaxID=362413 RepID=UPI00091605A5|nr:hypothetical protein [Flavobacterium aquidurense]OXA73899.1 hypothetical protein B0A67_02250 [Flavobacterium aquidurense]SHH39872.1 hypothetical protein SAMN05444481_11669 [Flavobacterium frigidimaris]